ncbi:MAG: hypothetical protein AAFO62_03105 [Pseudomonadota bacterium]
MTKVTAELGQLNRTRSSCVMRFISLLAAALTGLAALTIGSSTAQAFGWDRTHAPRGYGKTRTVRHYVYRPRYRHRYRLHSHTDPYRYRYEPRGYYPYYNSGYWRPAHKVRRRYRFHQPRYYPAWGSHKRHYKHHRWHHRNHGRHRAWHW